MKRPTGRRPSFPQEIMRIIGEKTASREFTIRNTCRIYGVSHGAVSAWRKNFAGNTPRLKARNPELKLPKPKADVKLEMETEVLRFMKELSSLDQDLLNVKLYHDALFSN